MVAGAEDGSMVIWYASNDRLAEAQVIVHPGCVWGVSTLIRSSDFVTACHNGHICVFTQRPSRTVPDPVLSSFREAAEGFRAARSLGPSPEEIAQLPAWERNVLMRGKSEGQVQVIQHDSRAVAAQWSAISGTWIEVGEVTGTNTNAGMLDGRRYDHVLPIEIDMPGGLCVRSRSGTTTVRIRL
ncbi:hypothetical protein ACHAW5_007979 [Stephanodiscus triporus]|uniref:PFU domain-containing protein n=1 Tax=Stephanodiscus triporus TaxID=2934178 RepID=A0ABD3QY87_9STRA